MKLHPARLLFPLILAAALSSATRAAAPVTTPAPRPAIGSIERLDPALDAVLAADAKIEQLAEGFRWSEGPVWLPAHNAVAFTDVPANTAYRWSEADGLTVFLQPSGFTGLVAGELHEGANGLALDRAGRLLLCQHGDRRVARLGADGKTFETIVDRFEGRRFNSPNDLCVDRAGNLFFTDPPYGLGKSDTREVDWNGVYRLGADGRLTVLHRDLDRPNGIALSPDERTLYVANSGDRRTFVAAFDLHADGTAGPARVLFDATALRAAGRPGLMDGLRVDVHGNLWASGPGGILILDPAGKHLGTILTGRATANCCFGGADGSTLFITANNLLLRVATKTKGATLR